MNKKIITILLIKTCCISWFGTGRSYPPTGLVVMEIHEASALFSATPSEFAFALSHVDECLCESGTNGQSMAFFSNSAADFFFFNFFFISHPSGILPALPPIETFQRGIANLLFISLVTINQFPSRRGALHAAISRKTFWIDADCYKLKNKESHLSTSFGTFFYSFFSFFLFVSFARMWCAVDIILPLVLFDNWIQFDKFFSHQSWLCGIEISNFKFFIQISNNKEKKLSKK